MEQRRTTIVLCVSMGQVRPHGANLLLICISILGRKAYIGSKKSLSIA